MYMYLVWKKSQRHCWESFCILIKLKTTLGCLPENVTWNGVSTWKTSLNYKLRVAMHLRIGKDLRLQSFCLYEKYTNYHIFRASP